MEDALKFLHRDEVVTKEEASEYPVLALGLDDDNTVEAFDSHEELKNRVERTKHANDVLRIDREITSGLENPHKFDDAAVKRHNAKVKKITEDLNKLAERTGLVPGSEALFRRATTERPPNEPPIFDTGIAFDNWTGPAGPPFGTGGDCVGRGVPLFYGLRDLRGLEDWWGDTWNDRITCVYFAGVLVLCEHTWWRGRRVWLFGAWKVNLGWLNFDNVASSYFTV